MMMTTVTVAVEMEIQRMNNNLFSYDYVFSGCNSSQAAVQHHEDHQTQAFIFYSPNTQLAPLLMYLYCFLKAFTYKERISGTGCSLIQFTEVPSIDGEMYTAVLAIVWFM
jgi:hypothetical protein